jgi:hypothetical protein
MTFSLNFGVESRVFLAPSTATLSGSHISIFYENLVFPLMVRTPMANPSSFTSETLEAVFVLGIVIWMAVNVTYISSY